MRLRLSLCKDVSSLVIKFFADDMTWSFGKEKLDFNICHAQNIQLIQIKLILKCRKYSKNINKSKIYNYYVELL